MGLRKSKTVGPRPLSNSEENVKTLIKNFKWPSSDSFSEASFSLVQCDHGHHDRGKLVAFWTLHRQKVIPGLLRS